MGNNTFKLFVLLFFTSFTLISQNVKGIILDSKTNAPLIGASVYFNNTNIGVITDLNGEFSFNIDNEINSPLIISFLGYKSNNISKVEKNKTYKVLLEEDISVLNEVIVVSKDEWTRAYKMEQFKTQFLGSSKFSEKCKILNEGVIRLRFNKKENRLIPFAKQPIIIVNEALGYEIAYDLQNFEINYLSYNYKIDNVKKTNYKMISVFYSGTTFYKNLTSQSSKKAIKTEKKLIKAQLYILCDL